MHFKVLFKSKKKKNKDNEILRTIEVNKSIDIFRYSV